MKYSHVFAFSALALAQGPQGPPPSCPSVVTATAYQTFYYCPCSSSSSTGLMSSPTGAGTGPAPSGLSTSTTPNGGQVGPTLGQQTSAGASISSTISVAPNPPINSPTSNTGTGSISIAPPIVSSGTAPPPPPPAGSTTNSAPPPPASPPPGAGTVRTISLATLGDYQSRALFAHNLHRANSSIANLIWNPTMATYAMQLAMTCNYGHSQAQGDGNYGQNIGAGFTADEIPIMITNSMYNQEINNFPGYGQNNVDLTNFGSWGHFSQIVWSTTTSVGCATYDCSANPGGLANTGPGVRPLFTVCNYFPPGNVNGQWSLVAQPQGGQSVMFQ